MKKEKFDILVFTAMNERHTVSRLWCISMTRFIEHMKYYKIGVLAVVSQIESVNICNMFGFNSVITKNNPLGRKFNFGMKYALDNYIFEYVLIMGDDDILLDKAALFYDNAIRNNVYHAGFGSLYFWKPSEHKASIYSYEERGLSKDKLIGCGRLIHRTAIEASGYRQDIQITKPITIGHIFGKISPGFVYQFSHKITKYLSEMKFGKAVTDIYFGLWDDTQEKGLDNESEIRLILSGYMPQVICPISVPVVIDVKTDNNIWQYEKYIDYGKEVKEIELTGQLSAKEIDYVNTNLRK